MMKTLDQIEAMINEHDLENAKSVSELQSRIERELTLSEIVLFEPFLRGGSFSSPAGWTVDHAGFVAKTAKADSAIRRMWRELMYQAWTLIGAAAVLDRHGAHRAGGYAFGSGGDLYDCTIRECAEMIPKEQSVLAFLKSFWKMVEKGFDDTRHDFAEVGDTMCEIVGEKRIPPEPKKVDQMSRRDLYEHIRRIKAKRGVGRKDLETFMEKSTWKFRGFSIREIYGDVEGLNKFYNAERMAIRRQEQAMQ